MMGQPHWAVVTCQRTRMGNEFGRWCHCGRGPGESRGCQGGQLRPVTGCVPPGLERLRSCRPPTPGSASGARCFKNSENVGAVELPSQEAFLKNGTSSLSRFQVSCLLALQLGPSGCHAHVNGTDGFLSWYQMRSQQG